MSEQAEPRPLVFPAGTPNTPAPSERPARNVIRLGPRARRLIRAVARIVKPR